MLDSVDPDAVRAAMEHADTSLFMLASKSGSTIEPNVMAAEAHRRVIAAGAPNGRTRFIAITDEDTALHRRAIGGAIPRCVRQSRPTSADAIPRCRSSAWCRRR